MPSTITLLCLDVDGVLTDGSIAIDDHGVETKRFHVRDGAGMRIWKKLGGEIAIITGRKGSAIRHRCNELGIRNVIQGSKDKAAAFRELLIGLDLDASQCAMIGDDLADLSVLQVCGYAIAVADACAEVRAIADFTTVRPGGHGAVREAIEHLLKEQNRWGEALALFE